MNTFTGISMGAFFALAVSCDIYTATLATAGFAVTTVYLWGKE